MAKEAKVSLADAVASAKEKSQGGTPIEAELKMKHGKVTWEIEVLGADGKVTEVDVDATGGSVVDTEQKKK